MVEWTSDLILGRDCNGKEDTNSSEAATRSRQVHRGRKQEGQSQRSQVAIARHAAQTTRTISRRLPDRGFEWVLVSVEVRPIVGVSTHLL